MGEGAWLAGPAAARLFPNRSGAEGSANEQREAESRVTGKSSGSLDQTTCDAPRDI